MNMQVILYIEILILLTLVSFSIPFVADNMYQKYKAKKLALEILNNQKYEHYTIFLIETLMKNKSIHYRYLEYILNFIISKLHMLENHSQLNYFQGLKNQYHSDETINKLPSEINSQFKILQKSLDEPEKTILNHVSMILLEKFKKSSFFQKLSVALTIVSILITGLGIYISMNQI